MTRLAYCTGILALSLTTICISEDVNHVSRAAIRSTSFTTQERTIAPKLTLAGVQNFGEVNSTLYRGAQPTEAGFENLARMGVTVVVNLRERGIEKEHTQVARLGMRYVALPWSCFHPEDTTMARFLALLRENRGKKVFVHCQTGDDRTGMMIAAYRMAEQGWTAEDAMKEMAAYGFTSSHYLICPGLSSYEETFPRRFKTSPAFRKLRR
jgi:protein tyrosine/serine phosphatase